MLVVPPTLNNTIIIGSFKLDRQLAFHHVLVSVTMYMLHEEIKSFERGLN
jgi:hypothetical protein